MSGAATIAARLVVGGGRRTALDLGLSAVGVAVSVAITLLVLGGLQGLDVRQERTAWRDPALTPPGQITDPIGLQQRTAERFGDTTIEVVRLSSGSTIPSVDLPPGLPRLPAAGQIVASPAVVDLLDGPAGDLLLPRLGTEVVGTITPAGLAYEGEVVAVVGADLVPSAADEFPDYDYRGFGEFEPSPVTEIATFAGDRTPSPDHTMYLQLFGFAGILLVTPSILLLGAAARFTAARRARRLAGLRLTGASPGQITRIATFESAVGAVAGVVVGIVLASFGRVAVAAIPLGGGPFGSADLIVPWPQVVAVAICGVLIALVATLTGLRAVRASPLGVVRPGGRSRPSILRVAALIAVMILFGLAASTVRGGGDSVVLMAALALVIVGVGLVGPWFTWVLGWLTARLARRPAVLIAGRAMTTDSIGAFRPSTPLVFGAFIGGFLLVITGTTQLFSPGSTATTALQIPAPATTSQVTSALDAAKVDATGVSVGTSETPFGQEVVVILEQPERLESVRTALDGLVDPQVAVTAEESEAENFSVLTDIGRGVLLLLGLALVQAAAATGVGASASVLEQGPTLAALQLSGMPLTKMMRVRLLYAGIPVATIAAISTGLGAGAAATIILATLGEGGQVGLGSLIGPPLVVVAATVAALVGAACAWPVLRNVTAQPLTDA